MNEPIRERDGDHLCVSSSNCATLIERMRYGMFVTCTSYRDLNITLLGIAPCRVPIGPLIRSLDGRPKVAPQSNRPRNNCPNKHRHESTCRHAPAITAAQPPPNGGSYAQHDIGQYIEDSSCVRGRTHSRLRSAKPPPRLWPTAKSRTRSRSISRLKSSSGLVCILDEYLIVRCLRRARETDTPPLEQNSTASSHRPETITKRLMMLCAHCLNWSEQDRVSLLHSGTRRAGKKHEEHESCAHNRG
jgi:hypothetical protein